jgi:hypothetical protein
MKTKSLFEREKRKETTKCSWLERVLPPSIPIFNHLRINITMGKMIVYICQILKDINLLDYFSYFLFNFLSIGKSFHYSRQGR